MKMMTLPAMQKKASKKSQKKPIPLPKLQQKFARAIMRPLVRGSSMQSKWIDGSSMKAFASTFIKPNNRLSSFERLEIYNCQYWYRILECFYDDFQGLRMVIGDRQFNKLAYAYLSKHPSGSFTLRDLGVHLEKFLRRNSNFAGKRIKEALEVVKVEWAQVMAFDAEEKEPIKSKKLVQTNPSKLFLKLQPHIQLLELEFPIDDFLVSLRREEMKAEASNAVSKPKHHLRTGLCQKLKRQKLYLAIHRHDFKIYFKRLDQDEFKLLMLLQKGRNLNLALEKVLNPKKRSPEEWGVLIQKWFQEWSALGWLVSKK
jgi:hypothetical protein